MTETRDHQVEDVARYYNMSPSRLGIKGQASYNSKSEDNRDYLDTTLSPWLCMIAGECKLKLLSKGQKQAGSHYFEHDTSLLLAMDAIKRHQYYAMGIRNGVYSPNECRKWENLPPREGGDEYVSLSKPIAGGSSDGGTDKQPADGSGNTKDKPTEDPTATRQQQARRRVVYGICRHARDKARNAKAYCELVDGGLQSHRREATELLGTDADVDAVLTQLRDLTTSVKAKELAAAVDALTAKIESEL